MKLEDVKVGKIYRCKLSGLSMLISQTQKSVQLPNGKNDEHGNPDFDHTTVDVKAGKYVEVIDGVNVFKYDEIYEGQLETI